MNLIEKRNNEIENFLGVLESKLNTSIDIRYNVEIDELDFETAYDEIRDQLQDKGIFNVDIIYYGSAMAYLTENDTSLKESLEIANEMGFELQNLSSETLASLLASRNLEVDFCELETEITQYFEDLTTNEQYIELYEKFDPENCIVEVDEIEWTTEFIEFVKENI